jgi:hypothetical protein
VQGPIAALFNSAHPASAPAAPAEGLRIFGVTLIGATQHNFHKLLLTVAFIAIAWVIAWVLR